MVEKFDGVAEDLTNEPKGTPQKNFNKKNFKGGDGEAVLPNNPDISAASNEEDRQEQ